MDIQRLKYFYTVAKLQHVTKAAEEIHIAQPSLTQSIQTLEKELGVPLFQKQGRRVVLTDYGKYLQGRLDTLLPAFDNLQKEMELLKTKVNKTVKLNILANSSFVIDVIVKYRKRNPDAVFDFEQNHLTQDCDILIATNGVDYKSGVKCLKRTVKKERIYLAVPKDSIYARKTEINLEEVKDEGFIMLSNLRLFGAICKKYCSMAGFTPKVLFESDSPIAVQNMISTGAGVAFWAEYWGKVKNKNVVLLPIAKPLCERDLFVELRERFPKSEYAEDFYKYLLQQLKKNEEKVL